MSAQKIGDAFVQVGLKGAATVAQQIEALKKAAEKQAKTGVGGLSPMAMGFGAGLGAGAALLAIKGLEAAIASLGRAINKVQDEILEAVRRLSDLQKVSDRISVKAPWMSVMRLAIRDSNMGINDFEQMIAALQRNIETFSHNVGESKDTFQSMEISSDTLKSWGDASRILDKLTERIGKFKAANERGGAAMRVMGEMARKFEPTATGNVELLRNLVAQGEFIGLAHSEEGIRDADDLRDAYVKLELSVQGLWETLAIQLAPALRTILDYSIVAVKSVRDIVESAYAITDGFKGAEDGAFGLSEGIDHLFATAFSSIVTFMGAVQGKIAGIVAIAGELSTMLLSYAAAIETATTGEVTFFKMATAMKEASFEARRAAVAGNVIGNSYMATYQKFLENLNIWRELQVEEAKSREKSGPMGELTDAIVSYTDLFKGEALQRNASTMMKLAERQAKDIAEMKRGIAGIHAEIKDAAVIGVAG